MVGKITLWTLEIEDVEPDWFGKVASKEASTYVALKLRLEENETLEWMFDFRDNEDNDKFKRSWNDLMTVVPMYTLYVVAGVSLLLTNATN